MADLDKVSGEHVTERPFGYRSAVAAPGRPPIGRIRSGARDPRDARGLERSPPPARAGRGGLGRRPHPGTEVPARAERIREALAEAGARFVEAEEQPRRGARRGPRFGSSGLPGRGLGRLGGGGAARRTPARPGRPLPLPHPDFVPGVPPAIPVATAARAGLFAYDTMTLIGPGTWEAARAAADVALTAADLVGGGEPAAYACCRPPGHHVDARAFGGSCYLNNSAVAAARAARRGARPGGRDRHRRPPRQRDPGDLLRGRRRPRGLASTSTRAPDGSPTTSASATRPGGARRPAPTATCRCARAPTTGHGCGGASARRLGRAKRAPEALVVPLGVDAAEGDPESPLRVTAEGYRLPAGRSAPSAANRGRPGGRLRPGIDRSPGGGVPHRDRGGALRLGPGRPRSTARRGPGARGRARPTTARVPRGWFGH